jgi:catechol 2,3-dioxygenase-like lactoylglutathione lyase family enzyme
MNMKIKNAYFHGKKPEMLKEKIISGIQQIGIGVHNVHEAWNWYRENFGMDIRIFEDAAVAELMLAYTGGVPRKRHAALTMNLQGGGGFEIWQYVDRTPVKPAIEIQAGDLGIYITKIKTRNARQAYEAFKKKNLNVNGLSTSPDGKEHFFVKDPYNNLFQVVESHDWFINETGKSTGAAYGAIIGVSDIEKARGVYSGILGYDTVIYDKEGVFEDLKSLPGGDKTFRRVLLSQSKPVAGSFSKLLGSSIMELIQVTDRKPEKIFKDRYWGDLGFIHICYDIKGMAALRTECESKGFAFTVDSTNTLKTETFDMGEAAGHFAYIEDPDGTLIEFVETDKIPILKKLGWYIDLRKRDPKKPLPDWILKTLKFGRVKEKHLVGR